MRVQMRGWMCGVRGWVNAVGCTLPGKLGREKSPKVANSVVALAASAHQWLAFSNWLVPGKLAQNGASVICGQGELLTQKEG